MKRICTLLLTMALLFSLAACGNGGQGAVTPSPAASGDSTPNTPEQSLTDNESPAPLDSQQPTPNDSADPSGSQALGSQAPVGDQPPAATGNPSAPAPEQSSPTIPSQAPVPVTPPAQSQVPTAQTPPPASAPPVQAAPEPDGPKILIAYFTWADNTSVTDQDAALESAFAHYDSMGDSDSVNVDAVTSASILPPGNAAQMARWIQEEVGGDLHSIQVEELYPDIYDDCLDRAADEKADNARPALATHVDNFEDYDVVFLGFPNWWYTLPMPVLSFVEEYDWSGKTVVPFVTHGTGGKSGTIRDLTNALPDDVTLLDSIGVYRSQINSSKFTVQEWVRGLDLEG